MRSKMRKERMMNIINAAIKVFAEKGFDAASMDEVAKMCGVSKGTIFLYFKSKDELIQSVALLSVPHDIINEVLRRDYNNARDLLIDFGMRFMEKYSNRDLRSLLMLTMAYKDRYGRVKERLRETCMDKMNEMFRRVETLTGHSIPMSLRRAFFGALMCYTIWWDENEMEPRKFVEELVDSLLSATSLQTSQR
ncbi:TetR/AcrR family transcriptional regulator [Vulcanisaeta sp. JCM 16159]|uniref:TetR/AcrR family transcriptional regulator n=1 Tax=Vulcanisaeta sp. JCM 16159 TaxID=1295371 RepID=UPI000B11E249|nr:TetR/AcrR family transcriptional regulator [Vulcanisaeta sp. JCM 16159]